MGFQTVLFKWSAFWVSYVFLTTQLRRAFRKQSWRLFKRMEIRLQRLTLLRSLHYMKSVHVCYPFSPFEALSTNAVSNISRLPVWRLSIHPFSVFTCCNSRFAKLQHFKDYHYIGLPLFHFIWWNTNTEAKFFSTVYHSYMDVQYCSDSSRQWMIYNTWQFCDLRPGLTGFDQSRIWSEKLDVRIWKSRHCLIFHLPALGFER